MPAAWERETSFFGLAALAPEGMRKNDGSAGAETLRLKYKKSSLPAPAHGDLTHWPAL